MCYDFRDKNRPYVCLYFLILYILGRNLMNKAKARPVENHCFRDFELHDDINSKTPEKAMLLDTTVHIFPLINELGN